MVGSLCVHVLGCAGIAEGAESDRLCKVPGLPGEMLVVHGYVAEVCFIMEVGHQRWSCATASCRIACAWVSKADRLYMDQASQCCMLLLTHSIACVAALRHGIVVGLVMYVAPG